MKITAEQLEAIGRLVDKADNLIAATNLPVAPRIHVEGLRSGLEQISQSLRDLYIAIADDNPWRRGD